MVQPPAGLTGVNPAAGLDCLLVVGTPVRDLLLCAKQLFVAVMQFQLRLAKVANANIDVWKELHDANAEQKRR